MVTIIVIAAMGWIVLQLKFSAAHFLGGFVDPIRKDSMDTMPTSIILLAAGSGSRHCSELPKQFCNLLGEMVFLHSARKLCELFADGQFYIVVNLEHEAITRSALKCAKIEAHIVGGGSTRRDSVQNALEAIKQSANPPDRVIVHDAARPLFAPDDVLALMAKLDDGYTGAIIARPVTDTIKQMRTDDVIASTIDRSQLARAQTPQAFDFGTLLSCHHSVSHSTQVTDDASLLEACGLDVAVVMGSVENDKITYSGDIDRMAAQLAAPDTPPQTSPALPDIRMATGFDVHAFEDGDHVVLCGVNIPHDKGLKGHSDADVGLHALTDAILGCCAAGDIGQHFPPSDPQWKGAESGQFLTHAVSLLSAAGGVLRHVDVTLICEAPKIGPHCLAMRQRIAELTGLELARVSVKATTSEKLGFTGRKEGIAVQAAATAVFI